MDKMCLFSEQTFNYLKNSFRKVGINEHGLENFFQWLSTTPKWSTIRINRNMVQDLGQALQEIQSNLNETYQQLNMKLNEHEKLTNVPKCEILSEEISECVTFNCSVVDNMTPEKKSKMVIVDLKCAQAVLRGADVFIPGVISLSANARQNEEISIFADLAGKCLKGCDANLYADKHPESLYHIGNGWLLFDRDYIFKNSTESKTGVGVKIKVLRGNYFIPSLDSLDERKFYLQNLPSIICGRVLDPRPGELILDICAAPGGKTTHIAEIINNHGRIIALDKISSKIEKMKNLCSILGAKVECFCQDATKIDSSVYQPSSFDRILADVPCSALGQRPLIRNDISINQLRSYVGYQKMILEKAVELLRPGGVLVYSTCTITIEENEEQVAWLLSRFNDMELVSQEPFYLAANRGFECDGLGPNQAHLVQRFMPGFKYPHSNDLLKSVYSDTNGFFIAKFIKKTS